MQSETLEKIISTPILCPMNILASLQAIDIQLLDSIRNTLTIRTEWFPTFIFLIADSQPILFSLFLIGLWMYGWHNCSNGPKHVALDLFWHVMGAFMIYWIINHLLPIRPRPEAFTSLPPLIAHFPDNSFPSGHAMFFGASWWALYKLGHWKSITLLFFLLGCMTVLSRVIAGIHYPGDIIVGFFLGWGIVHILISLPHGKIYRKYAQDVIVNMTGKIGL